MKFQRSIITLTVALAALAIPGCKKRYGAGCEKATTLTSPWTDLSLPIQDDEARVCESSSDSLKVRAYTWSDEASAQSAFKSALVAAGYTEDRCSDKACYFDKDGYQISVQPQKFKVRKKKIVTVVLRRREDPSQKRKKKT